MSDELHDLVGMYAIDALDEADATRFEAHLETCDICQNELFSMSPVVMELAAAPTVLATPTIEPVATVHDIGSRRKLPRLAAAAAAVAIVAGLWVSGIFTTSRVEVIASAADVEAITLEGEGRTVQVVLSNSEQGVALESANLDALAEPNLYVLWVIRHNGDAPEFVGNITDFSDIDKAWDISVNNVEVLAISIEEAPSPTTPSDNIVFVGQRDLG